ncbi:MAG: CpaD family pilus assembly protein [Pseudomonadota bacterium]
MKHDRLAAFLPAALSGALLAACATPPQDYRTAYPIHVEKHTVALPLDFSAGRNPLEGQGADRFAALVAAYLDRSSGKLVVALPRSGGTDTEAFNRARLIEDQATALGVPLSAIELRLSDADPAGRNVVVLRFDRYTAQLPTCGDWSAPTHRDPYNMVHANFGCATQRNIGLMVADPADLIRQRQAGTHDVLRSTVVLGKYRAGDEMASKPERGQTEVIAKVGGGQ